MTTHAYLRVSTDEQASSGLGLAAQRATIEQSQHVPDEWHADEGVSGSTAPAARPVLGPLLDRLQRGDVLVVAKLDRLTRSMLDLPHVVERADREGWSLVLLDVQMDTTTPHGRFVAHVMGASAEMERDLIRARTSAALQALKAQGVALGQQVRHDDAVLLRILDEREQGASLRAIADGLNADGIPTSKGARWAASTVSRAARSVRAAALREGVPA